MSGGGRKLRVTASQGMMVPMPMPMQMPMMMAPLMQPADHADSVSEEERDAQRDRERQEKKPLHSRYQKIGGRKCGLLKKHKLELVEDIANDASPQPGAVDD